MLGKTIKVTVLMGLLAMSSAGVFAAGLPEMGGVQRHQGVGTLMTAEERDEMKSRIGAATSFEEKQAIRAENRELMQMRAKEQGIEMPEAGQGGGKIKRGGGMGGKH